MKKPDGWDAAQAITGDFSPLPADGYICKIMNALVVKSNGGKEMLSLSFDIAEGEYSGYYRKMFDRNNSENKKWPGIYNQLTEGASLPFFKGLISCIEASNAGYKWNWDEKTLKGKLFGGLFGREEYFSTMKGEYRWSTKLMSIRSVQAIQAKDFAILPDKPAQNKDAYSSSAIGVVSVETLHDDDLPF